LENALIVNEERRPLSFSMGIKSHKCTFFYNRLMIASHPEQEAGLTGRDSAGFQRVTGAWESCIHSCMEPT
jgi:hypothetical protein